MSTQPAKAARPGSPEAPFQDSAPLVGEADTPAERRKRKVRDSIIEAAGDVFALEGEAGLSMRRLADRIDYSPAAIYKYFRSKDELLAELREQFFERLLAQMSEARAAGLTGKQRLDAALRAYIRTGLDNPNHYRLAMSGTSGPPAEGTRGYEAAIQFTALIAGLVASGDLRDLDPRLASTSVWAALHGITSLMASLPAFPEDIPQGGVGRDELIEWHVDLLIRGLERARE